MIVTVAMLVVIAAVWYRNSVYPYKYAEKFYEDNKKNIEQIVEYFENLDNVYSAQMDTNGTIEIVSANGSEKSTVLLIRDISLFCI